MKKTSIPEYARMKNGGSLPFLKVEDAYSLSARVGSESPVAEGFVEGVRQPKEFAPFIRKAGFVETSPIEQELILNNEKLNSMYSQEKGTNMKHLFSFMALVAVMVFNLNAQQQETIDQTAGQLAQQYFLQNGVTPVGNGGGITPEAMTSQTFIGHANGEQLGYSMAPLGDINGDGFLDIALGAHCYNSNTGRVYIYLGGAQMNTTADLILNGGTTNSYFGFSIAGPGDINGDGYADVVVGAYGDINYTGSAYIYYGGTFPDNQADVVINGDAPNNYFGGGIAGVGDVNGDGYPDIMIAANGFNGNNGKVSIYFGSNNWFFDTAPDVVLNGNSNSYFGSSVAAAGDVNGDGYADVLVGEWPLGSSTGRANLFYGGAAMNTVVDLQMVGSAPNMRYSMKMAGGRDINGDGYSDFVIAGYGHNSYQGRVDVFFGGPNLDQSGDLLLYGDAAESDFGFSVALADVNSDGFGDVIVGASRNRGKAFVFFGKTNMDDISDVRMTGELDNTYFGICVAAAGDMNNDGYEEFLVSASGFSGQRGKVYLYKNTFTGADIPDIQLRRSTGWSGSAVANAGDVNGDGYNDLIVGAYGVNSYRGEVCLYYGGNPMDTIPDVFFYGSSSGAYFGKSISAAGDVNGDGYADIIIGAYNHTNGSGSAAIGQAYVYYGGTAMDNIADVVMQGEHEGAYFGWVVCGAGDVNGDGYDDVAVTSPKYNSGANQMAGRVYFYYGGAMMDSIADKNFTHGAANLEIGTSIACAGDVNGDGYSDVIVGNSLLPNSEGQNVGGAWLFLGGASFQGWPRYYFYGPNTNSFFGLSVSTAGDVNRDGYSDFIIGSQTRAYLFYGGAQIDTTKGFSFEQTQWNMNSWHQGKSIAAAGDVNGDGFSDIVYGLPAELNLTGKAYILYGGTNMDTIPDVAFSPLYYQSWMGVSVAGAGDLNGDGLADVMVGALGANGLSSNGGSALIYLSSSGPVKPRIVSVKDVPGDQGGKVNISFYRSGYDLPGMNKLTRYTIERSVAGGIGGMAWNSIATVSPSSNLLYCYEAATQSDSAAYMYRVTANTTNSFEFWRSNIMSGMSIDNLAPAAVKSFSGAPTGMNNGLRWKANTEADLHSYAIYRAATNSIDPNTVTPVATLTDTVLTDTDVPVGDSYYFIRAKDIHGNYGALTALSTPLGMREVAVTALIEGFYDENANSMIQDTLTVALHNSSAPYARVEQSQTYLNASGTGAVRMRAAENTGNYYVVVKHRNAIETWSKEPQAMTDSRISYDFTTAATTAYGDNLKQKGSKWCIFSGDVNQDGIVDYSDLSAIDNDSYNYVGGYVTTDVTGDEFVDYTDLTIADNNNFNYVSVQSPLALLKKGTTAQADNTSVPTEYEVSRNYPNPFNPSTRINYALPQDSRVVVNLFNMLGEKIATVIDKEEGAGYHTAMINMNNLPSGAYILHFTAGDYRKVQKIMLMK